MKRNQKAIVSLALAVLMFVMVMPLTALAGPAPNYGYSSTNDTITVNLSDNSTNYASGTNFILRDYTVRLYGSGYDQTYYTVLKGTYVTFSNLYSGTTYTLVVTANFTDGSTEPTSTTITTGGNSYNNNNYNDKSVISKPTPYTSGNAVFIVAGAYNRLNGVSLNGYSLSNGSQYTAEYYDYNRVRVTIYSNALDKLSNGYHGVVFSFSDGYASTNFQVSRSSSSQVIITPPTTTTLTANYTVTASSLRVREWGSTSARQVGSLPRGTQVTVLETSSGWGRINLNGGRSGWVSMQYLRQVGSSSIGSSSIGSGIIMTEPVGSTGTYGTYYTTVGLRMRSGPSTSYGVLGVLPSGTAVSVTRFDGEWAVCSINGQTVYVHTNYLRK